MTEISELVGIKGKSGTLLPKIENTGRGYIQRGRGNRINEHKSRIIGFIVPVQYWGSDISGSQLDIGSVCIYS